MDLHVINLLDFTVIRVKFETICKYFLMHDMCSLDQMTDPVTNVVKVKSDGWTLVRRL